MLRVSFRVLVGVCVSGVLMGDDRLFELGRSEGHSVAPPSSDRQHVKGKLGARERVELLLDRGSFEEYQSMIEHRCDNFGLANLKTSGDSVITGHGTIAGRRVVLYSQDFSVLGGTVSESNAKKICAAMDIAIANRLPLISINDSGGARIQEGVDSLAGYGEIFRRNVAASGVIPQIALVMGPCAGGAVYSPALMDFIFMVEDTSYMFLTGPNVVKKVTYEDVSKEDLGGAGIHAKVSGIVARAFVNDLDLISYFRYFCSFLPEAKSDKVVSDRDHPSPGAQEKDFVPQLGRIVPVSPTLPYDVRDILFYLLDDHDFCELYGDFATNIVVGFGRIYGKKVGIVANQPLKLAGCLDSNASCKAARFIRFCDSFGLPILSLVDVPGFLPGVYQEQSGIIKHGAKLLYAYAEASVPVVTIITRKAYGGAYIVMGSKHLGADINFAWDTAEIAVMGAEGAIEILFRKQLGDSQKINTLVDDYRRDFANPYRAASRGFIDEVIAPGATKARVGRALELLSNKHASAAAKHGNIPL